MLLLHLLWHDQTWLLWGEAPAAPRHGRAHASAVSPPLPFGAGQAALCDALGALAIAVPLDPPHLLTLWLPTSAGQPWASNPLIQPYPTAATGLAYAPWQILALPIDWNTVIALLGYPRERELLGPGIVAGADLRWWERALRFALDLVARQRAVPTVAQIGGRLYARWQPVFLGTDDAALTTLAQAMPALVRAVAPDVPPPSEDPAVPGADALAARAVADLVLTAMVDRLMRPEPRMLSEQTSPRSAPPGGARPSITSDHASIHDQWLAALLDGNGRLVLPRGEQARFIEQVREWTQRLLLIQQAPVRLCLRLEEPVTEDEPWTMRYLAQSRTDLSLLIPLAQLWRGKEATAGRKALAIRAEDLLMALGQAALIVPEIATSLQAANPWGYTLDTSGAFNFLATGAWLLEDAGVGVLLPSWWTRQGAKQQISARAHVKSPKLKGGNRLGLEDLIDVDWQIAIGDSDLTAEELERLAHLKEPLVRIRGQWVQVDAAAIQSALAFWRRRAGQQIALRDILRMARGGAAETAGLPVSDLLAEGWIADLLAQLDGGLDHTLEPLPAGLRATLRPYQARGYTWLRQVTRWGLGACLADDMGLGKTIQTLAVIQREWEEAGPAPVLLICPTSLLENWRKEAARFIPDLPVLIHHGAQRRGVADFAAAVADQALVLTSYGLAHRDADLLRAVHWRGVVLDEAQNIKNAATKQSQAVRSIAGGYHVALTGTPVENHVGDLWALMAFLNPGYLGSEGMFRRQFFLPIQINHDPVATTKLHKLTGPFILRRLKTDPTVISDLPEKLEQPVYVTLTREQASLYAATLKDLERSLDASEGMQRKGLVLATLTKLKQICNHPAQFLGDGSALAGRSGKLERMEAMLGEMLDEGERGLIFTQYAELAGMLRDYLQAKFGHEILLLTGKTPRQLRDQMVERFQSASGPPIFLLSLKAGGVGLNLTRASHVFHYDRWWNPAVENQATDRAFRIGQLKRVLVHIFVTAGTVEDRIAELIASKREIAASVVGAGEGWITELSSAEIRDLFALRETVLED